MTPVALRRAPTFDVQLLETDGTFATYKVAFDFKAICEAKAKLGQSLFNAEVWEKIENDPETLVTVLWTGLLSHNEVSLEELPYMMVPSKFGDYLNAILLAWTAVKPKVEETVASPKQEPTTEPVSVQK